MAKIKENKKTLHTFEGFRTSDEFFEQLIDSLEDYALFTCDPDGIITSWNSGAERLFGYSEKEIIGEDVAKLFISEDRAKKAPLMELHSAIKKGRAHDEKWHLRKDGSRFWASGLVFPLKDKTGKLQGFTKIARDLTARKKFEEEKQVLQLEVEAEKKKLADIFERAPAFMAIIRGKDHVFELANSAYYQLIGQRDILGKPVREVLPEVVKQGFIELLDNVLKTGKPYIGKEIPITLQLDKKLPPEQRYVNFVYEPIRDSAGKRTGIVAHGYDVTAQVYARQQIETISQERENERLRLEFGQRAGKIGTYEWDLITNKSVWTKEFEALYGYPKGGFKAGTTEAWLKLLHPDDRKWVRDETTHALENADELNTEYRVVWPDKTIHYLTNRAKIIRDKFGKAVRINGVNIDITERKLTEMNLTFLSKASKILASSLDYKTTLANVAKLAVPTFADWCSVTIKKSGELEELAVAHIDPKKIKWAKELREKNPPDPKANTGVPKVMRNGKSELYSHLTDDMLVASARNKAELELIRKLQMTSVMIVPLLLEGKAIGVITFVAAESGRHYTDNDLMLVEEIASRMALAIENARLYSEAKNADEAQKKLAAIVESSDDAIISKSIDGIITSWNKGAEQLYGYHENEIIGKPVSILMPRGKKNDFPWIMKQLQHGKKVEHYETKRLTKDGRILDVSITVSPIRDTNEKIIGASKIARDITKQKRAEQQQKFLNQASTVLGASIDYETTLKNLGKVIIPYLADYCRIVVLNEKKEIKEITINHVDHKKLFLVKALYASYKDNSSSGVGKILSTGKSEYMRSITPAIVKDANNKTITLIKKLHLQSYMGIPMKIGNRVVGALTFSSTRKERLYTQEDKALAEELAQRAALAIENARLYAISQKAVALRDEFISIASHELKTPVTSLKMYVQVTKKMITDSGGDVRNLDKMNTQVNKLTLLIQDLLNISRFQSGMLEYNDSEFDLNEIVDEVIETIQPTIPKHVIKIDGTLKQKVWGDKDRISQVIINLLTNASKYSPHADKIIIRLTPEMGSAVVTIQDFGIGIDKHHLNKLFERFYRVSDVEERTFPGLGLGLYISNEIIKRYGGRMSVTSQKGKGSQFSFTLPYKNQKA